MKKVRPGGVASCAQASVAKWQSWDLHSHQPDLKASASPTSAQRPLWEVRLVSVVLEGELEAGRQSAQKQSLCSIVCARGKAYLLRWRAPCCLRYARGIFEDHSLGRGGGVGPLAAAGPPCPGFAVALSSLLPLPAGLCVLV